MAAQAAPRLLLTALVLALSACALAPHVPPAPFAAPAQFKEDGLWRRAAPTLAVPETWWDLLDDPVLDALQRQLAIGNENLKLAVAQVANARAALQGSEDARQPTLSLGAGASRAGAPTATGNGRTTANSFSLSASASWELDLWGRLAQAVTVAGANLQASEDELAAARLSAQALLVQTYVGLRTAEAQQGLLQRSVAATQRTLELTEARLAAGVVGQSDVLQARTQLKTVQAQALESGLQRAQLEHAIAVLLGQPPSALQIARTAQLPDLPPVPLLLPSTLLERRPDIAAAERKVAAAYAQIGVADAAFFPDLTLSAGAGLKNASLGRLFSAPSLLWSLGPSLAFAVLDGGARRQASAQARAAADQATASYRQTVLTALQEVEDNLVAADQLGSELALQQDALQVAQRNLVITQDQYRAGTVSFLNVATAQTAALSAEGAVLSLRSRQLLAANVLLKNIGGRWQAAP